MRLLLTGTGTDVGKTWVGARLAPLLGATAWKPVQSYQPGTGPTDAEVLAAATGQDPHEVCPPHRWYPLPLAPPEAADELGRPRIGIDELAAEAPESDGPVVIEGAGGPRSPLAHDGDTVTLAAIVDPALIVLVSHAGLGAINDVRLSAAAFDDVAPLAVFLNRFDAGDLVHRRNLDFLSRDGFHVVTDLERPISVPG